MQDTEIAAPGTASQPQILHKTIQEMISAWCLHKSYHSEKKETTEKCKTGSTHLTLNQSTTRLHDQCTYPTKEFGALFKHANKGLAQHSGSSNLEIFECGKHVHSVQSLKIDCGWPIATVNQITNAYIQGLSTGAADGWKGQVVAS